MRLALQTPVLEHWCRSIALKADMGRIGRLLILIPKPFLLVKEPALALVDIKPPGWFINRRLVIFQLIKTFLLFKSFVIFQQIWLGPLVRRYFETIDFMAIQVDLFLAVELIPFPLRLLWRFLISTQWDTALSNYVLMRVLLKNGKLWIVDPGSRNPKSRLWAFVWDEGFASVRVNWVRCLAQPSDHLSMAQGHLAQSGWAIVLFRVTALRN